MSHLRTILPYFHPYRRGMIAGMVLVVVSNAFSVAGPWLLRLAIDTLEAPGVTRGRIVLYAGLIVAAAVLGGLSRYGMRELLNGISRRIECDLRSDFFRQLLRLDASFYGKERTGDIMTRATNDTLAVRQAVGPAVMYSVNTLVMSAFTLGLMLWISPRLTGLVLIPMVLLPPLVLWFGRVIHRRFQRIQEQFSTLSTQVQENLTGVRLIRAYVQEADQARRFDELNHEYMERNLHLVRAQGLFHPSLGLITAVATVIVVWIGGSQVMTGAISVGDLVAFIFYLNLLTWPMIALGWVVNLFQRGEASMERINEVLEAEPRLEPGRGRAPDGLEGRIEFRHVSFRYPGTERDILRDVSFIVEPGKTVAIVGPTGSGKSTIVSLIPRLYDPTGGSILLDDVPLREYDPRRLRAAMGIVPQDTFLFSDTIEANVGLGLEPDTEGEELDPRILRASEVAQLHDQVSEFPRGYDTRLGERGINLSGGQKQRAALARALARSPTVLILDDALSAVDTQTEARILEELRDPLRTRTSLIISHRVTAVMNADRILVVEDGRIVESGTHQELVEANGLYETLLRRQLIERSLADEDGDPFDGAGLRFARR
ncbi:MAG: ABC transporter ATP-binding protein [Gemmatimonadota bacterium]